ncbi:ABC transporter substrate-binding protein [Pseudonocardia ailaonensis]|uniref:ABC transporter substrate-binding protein n=1 Tax=Pseudonocardia ailaonensis TaxID=367279 RepID=A0ABN2N783_9PSEU
MSAARPRVLRRWLTTAAASSVLLVAAACGGGGASTATQTVKIGSVVPLTGAAAAVAGQYLAGTEAAINAANDAGGVNGRTIELVKVDDGFDISRTITGIRQLATKDQVAAIIGPYGTNAAAAVRPVAEQLKVPLVGPLAYVKSFYDPVSADTYALWPSHDTMFRAVTDYALTRGGVSKLAVVATVGDVGDGAVAGATAALGAKGLQPTVVVRVPNGAPDYSGAMNQAKGSGADGLVVLGDNPSMAKMLSDARRVGLQVPFFGGVSAADSGFAKLAGTTADGIIGVSTVDLSGKAAGWSDYIAAVAKYTKADPGSSYVASGYAAAQTVIGAIAQVKGTVDAASLTAALQQTKVDTIAGPVAFSKDSHLGRSDVYLTKIVNGQVTLTGDTVNTSTT